MTLLEDSAVLKNDCTTFIKVLNSVEEILLRAENLQSTGAIDDVREVLEEALGLMQAVQTRGMLSSTLLAKCEKNRFEELKKKLQEALGRLNLTATLEASALQQAKFDQMEQLRAHVTQLGGAEAVIKDPEALKEVTSQLEASDQLILASVSQAEKNLKTEIHTVGDEVAKARWQTLQLAVEQKKHTLLAESSNKLMEQSSQQLLNVAEGQRQQDEKLDDVTQSFIKLQQEAELSQIGRASCRERV